MEDLKWVHQLVDAEKRMEEKGLVDMTQERKSESFLRQETIDFLKNLKSLFIDAVGLFNQGRPFTTSPVNIYSIAGKPADFMLFRNSCKLLFTLKEPGCIQAHRAWIRRFYLPETVIMPSGEQRPTTNSVPNSSTRTDSGKNMTTEQTASSRKEGMDLIYAQWGALDQILWKFKGETLEAHALVRYYLTAFIKESVR